MTDSSAGYVLVTGASGGIGSEVVRRLDAGGANVILVGRNMANLEAVRESLRGGAHRVVECDLRNDAAIHRMATGLSQGGIHITGLAHLAGAHLLRPLQLLESGALNDLFIANCGSAVAITRALVTSRLVPTNGCSVVWTSSVAALRGGVGEVAYAASKGALIAAARAVAVEMARRKIRVNVVVPGVVRTPQSEGFLGNLSEVQREALRSRHLLGFGAPGDVAAVIMFLLSDGARWITGTEVVVDGGLSCH